MAGVVQVAVVEGQVDVKGSFPGQRTHPNALEGPLNGALVHRQVSTAELSFGKSDVTRQRVMGCHLRCRCQFDRVSAMECFDLAAAGY